MFNWYLAIASVIIVDQLSKGIVSSQLVEGQMIPMGGAIRLRRVTNVGGILSQKKELYVLVLAWLVAILSIFLLVRFVPQFSPSIQQIALGAAIGGATSNSLDRLFRHSILDFIDLKVWPVFNLADVAIVAGVLVSLGSMLWRK